jgi:hypothetical protein
VGEDTAVQRGGAPDPEQVLDAARSRTDRCRAASLRNASRSSAQVFASLVEAIERAALMPPKPAFSTTTFDACTPLGGRSPIFLRHRPVKLLDEEPTIPDLSQAVGDLDDLSQICSCGRIYLRCAQRSSARHNDLQHAIIQKPLQRLGSFPGAQKIAFSSHAIHLDERVGPTRA